MVINENPMSMYIQSSALNWHEPPTWAGPNLKQNAISEGHHRLGKKDDWSDREQYFPVWRWPAGPPTSTRLCSCNWPDHHRGRWVGSFPGLLWGVWTGRACHQNTSKDSSVPRARAGHMRRLQTGPCPRHSWRELTAECLEGRGSQSLNGKEWFLWSKSTALPSCHNVWLQLSRLTRTPLNQPP